MRKKNLNLSDLTIPKSFNNRFVQTGANLLELITVYDYNFLVNTQRFIVI